MAYSDRIRKLKEKGSEKKFISKMKENNFYDSPVKKIHIANIKENPYQPRMEIKDEELQDLANSIKEQGLLQPIVVAKEGSQYVVIAGHRRLAAHKVLGKEKIEAVVLENQTQKDLAAKAIVENFQREDLDIIELAIALDRYKKEFGKTLDEIAKEIGKSKDYISRLLSTLELPEEIVEDLRKNKSTKDVKALAEINSFARKIKKLGIPTFDEKEIKDTQKSLYYGLLENGYKWFKEEIKRKLSFLEGQLEERNRKKSLIKIKKDKRRGVTINVRAPNLNDEKIKAIEEAIQKIIKEATIED